MPTPYTFDGDHTRTCISFARFQCTCDFGKKQPQHYVETA